MLNYGVIGFGGLGKVHFSNFTALSEKAGGVKLVAVCDLEEERFRMQTATNLGNSKCELELTKYHLYTDAETMLSEEQLDFVIIAVPTYLHERIAVMAMERGIHVFSEKPMAINLEQAENMLNTAKGHNVKLMIGHCVRYWSAYKMLKEMIDSKRFGAVVRADFARISGTPIWGWQNWFVDEEKSGGVAIDLHIHDVDYINYVFGRPDSITSAATHYKTKFDSIYTTYAYGKTVVTARADWGMPSETYPFFYSFLVRFEKATVEMKDGVAVLYMEDGKKKNVELPQNDPYLDEVIDFVTCIVENRESTINPPESSLFSLKMAITEKQAAITGEKIYL